MNLKKIDGKNKKSGRHPDRSEQWTFHYGRAASFADDQAFRELFGDLKEKYGLTCILHGMSAQWPAEEEKWGFWSRLINHYCGEYKESKVMSDLKAIIGEKDYLWLHPTESAHLKCAVLIQRNL